MPTKAFPKYDRNSLRPNPEEKSGPLPFRIAVDSKSVGDFGEWDASPTRTNGLPAAKENRPKTPRSR